MTSSKQDLKRFLRRRSETVIEGWYEAAKSSAVAFHSAAEVRARLSAIWDEVERFLLCASRPLTDAERIGASFVSLRVGSRAAGDIERILLAALLQDLPRQLDAVLRPRVLDLAAGMTTGLIRAATESLLEQQEEIRAAYARSLRRAKEQLRVMSAGVESSINGVMIIDLDGRVTYVNHACRDMWGYESGREMVDRHVSDFGEWQGDVERALEILSRQGGWVGELVARRADGSKFDVHASVSPIRNDVGYTARLMAFFVDITARKQSQEALRRRATQAVFLNRIGEEIAGERTAERVLERAVKLAHRSFDFHRISIMLLDPQEERLTFAAMAGPPQEIPCEECSLALGEGIIGWVAQHNETLVVNDVETDPRYVILRSRPVCTRAEMAVPICRGGQVLGVLDIQSPEKDAFGRSERIVLETLSDQIAVALENARLYQALQEELALREEVEEALRRSVRRLETVHHIDQEILAAKSKEEIAQVVVYHVRQLVPCQRVSIDLFDWESNEVTVLAAAQTIGEGRALSGARFPLTHQDWLRDLWESRRLIDVPDARGAFAGSPLVGVITREGIRSFLGAPIGFQGDLLGLLTLGSDRLNGFRAEHHPIVRELADTVAIAIQQAQLFDSVSCHRERLRTTMARLAEAEENERRRVVRELHDQLGQNMTALDLNLSLIQSQLEQRGLHDLTPRLQDSLALVEQTTHRIRRLMIDLRPPVLDDYGLVAALHWYGDRFSTRTGLEVSVQGRENAFSLPPHVENALFRITQEALNNTVKHAQADRVAIKLTKHESGVRLTIVDNGVGFEPEGLEDERNTWGLLTMRERAESVGAWCLFDSTPGEGTRVVVEVPT